MRIFKRYFRALFFAVIVFSSWELIAAGEPSIPYDSLSRNWKSYDRERLETFRSDPDFNYQRAKTDLNLLERFWNWLKSLFPDSQQSGSMEWGVIIKYLLYGLGTVALIYLIIKIIQSRMSKLIYGDIRRRKDYHLSEENIHEIDFSDRIEEAVEKGEYRKAVRLIYLFALKILSDRQLISWESGKTNHDYLHELKDPTVEGQFNDLGYFFEFTWYGNFHADRMIYEKAYKILKELESRLAGNE